MGRILPMGRKIPLQVSFSRDDMAEQPVSYPLETVSKPASSNISLICVPCYAGVTDYAEARSVEERERHAQMKVLASKTSNASSENQPRRRTCWRRPQCCDSHATLLFWAFITHPLVRTSFFLLPAIPNSPSINSGPNVCTGHRQSVWWRRQSTRSLQQHLQANVRHARCDGGYKGDASPRARCNPWERGRASVYKNHYGHTFPPLCLHRSQQSPEILFLGLFPSLSSAMLTRMVTDVVLNVFTVFFLFSLSFLFPNFVPYTLAAAVATTHSLLACQVTVLCTKSFKVSVCKNRYGRIQRHHPAPSPDMLTRNVNRIRADVWNVNATMLLRTLLTKALLLSTTEQWECPLQCSRADLPMDCQCHFMVLPMC